MSTEKPGDVTRMLLAWKAGDEAADAQLMEAVYEDLRRIARRQMARERPGDTLQPTALVHEAYLRMVDQRRVEWRNRAQFFALAAGQMRRILIDRARRRKALKRLPVLAPAFQDFVYPRDLELLAFEEALERLGALSERQGQIAVYRCYGGLTVREIAHALGVSERTVKSDWRMARAFLSREFEL